MENNLKNEYKEIPQEIIDCGEKIERYAEKHGWSKDWTLFGIQARQPWSKKETTQKYIPDWGSSMNFSEKLYPKSESPKNDYVDVGHWTKDNWTTHVNNMTVLGTAIMNSGGNPFFIMKQNENFMKTLASNHIEIKQANYIPGCQRNG